MKNILIIFAVVLLISCTERKGSNGTSENIDIPTIEGAWTVTQIEYKKVDTSVVRKPWHKSIYMYTDKYYSIAATTGERPSKPELKEDEEIDSNYFKKVYLGYISNSGTYKIVGDSLIHNVFVAKSPTVMNNNTRTAQHISLEKNKMVVTSAGESFTTTFTLERLKE